VLWRLIRSSVGEGEKCIAYTIEETPEGKYSYKYKVDQVAKWLRPDGTYYGEIHEGTDGQ